MALNASFGIGGPIRRVMAKAHDAVTHLIHERTILLLTVMFCAGVAATLWHLSHLSSTLVKSGALQGTSLYSESLTELRTFYNSDVVERVRSHGIEVTHDYATKRGAIPIPATFTIEFGKHMGQRVPGMQIRLYSEYPFPFRKDGGPRDAFEREALLQLRKQPDKPFFRFEDFQGRPSLRYGTAVQMRAGCVSCHNSHPESPKTDWSIGDVRGVQEIIRPLDSAVAETREGLQDTFVLLAAMGLAGLGGLALVIGRMRRTSAELEQRVTERTAAEARLAALREINVAITSTLDLHRVLNILMEKIDVSFPQIAVQVWLKDRQSGKLERAACCNLDEADWKERQLTDTPSLVKAAMASKRPVVALNVQTDPRTLDREFYRRQGLVSYLGVPLVIQEEALGVLVFLTREEHQFTKEEIEFLSTLAAQAALAIHNSQNYQETAKLATNLGRSNEELERSNKVKDEFLSVISHELRTPLTSIIGYGGMLQDGFFGDVNREQEKGLGVLLNQTKDLLALINSILEVTKIGAGTMVLEKEEVDLKSLLDDLRSTYDTPLDKDLTLIWDYDSHLPSVSTDGGKLKRILQNLVNNAIKFTDKGNVTISARVMEGPEGYGQPATDDGQEATAERQQSLLTAPYVEFRVADTGIGIPREALPVIFEKFRQVDSTETRAFGGVGLGLHIVKEFTEMLGGKISADSEPGKGSVFTVSIPLEPQH